jgi:hypothetical protein
MKRGFFLHFDVKGKIICFVTIIRDSFGLIVADNEKTINLECLDYYSSKLLLRF